MHVYQKQSFSNNTVSLIEKKIFHTEQTLNTVNTFINLMFLNIGTVLKGVMWANLKKKNNNNLDYSKVTLIWST